MSCRKEYAGKRRCCQACAHVKPTITLCVHCSLPRRISTKSKSIANCWATSLSSSNRWTTSASAKDVDEAGTTFEANARLKADHYAELSGLLTLADDSGLEVNALNGEPGVHSRRWAGDVTDHERNVALLKRIQDVQDARRGARFRCAIAIAEPGQPTVVVEGHCDGRLAWEPHGDHGFGYDPLFFFPEFGENAGRSTTGGQEPGESSGPSCAGSTPGFRRPTTLSGAFPNRRDKFFQVNSLAFRKRTTCPNGRRDEST